MAQDHIWAPLAEGQTVEGTIDYDRRFSLMQLHSGEHILSGIVHRRFGYENVGFHMGTDFVTIDFSGILTQDDLAAPAKNVPGIITIGFDVPNAFLVRNGTAIPTKEIGPANAVTLADSTLESRISTTRKT